MEAAKSGTQRSVVGKARAAVILGNDAVVAARACTPDQLTNACRAAGFDTVVPPTWGDELVAAHYLELLANCTGRFTAACACPRVRSLVAQLPSDRAPACVIGAAPPVAAARYLRAVHGDDLLVTYVGDCPSAADPSIDACFSPAGFLASLERQGITFSGHAARDVHRDGDAWQRHLSTPGGLPALRFLARAPVDRVVREADVAMITGGISGGRAKVVIDLATAAGCACSAQRAEIEEREPPRSTSPVIAAVPGLDLGAQPSPRPGRQAVRPRRPRTELPARAEGNPSISAVVVEPPDTVTAAIESTPAVSESVAAAPDPTPSEPAPTLVSAGPAVAGSEPSSPATVMRETAAPRISNAAGTARNRPRPRRARSIVLLTLPIAILGGVTALGVAAYSTAATVRDGVAQVVPPSPPTDSVMPGAASLGDIAPPTPADSGTTTREVGGAIPHGAAMPPESTVVRDSARKQPPRKPRRAPEVIPGWMPQGHNAWTPDSNAGRKSDSTMPKPRPDTIPPA